MKVNCICQDHSLYRIEGDGSDLGVYKSVLANIRQKCPILNLIYPDDIWKKLEETTLPIGKAHHGPILLSLSDDNLRRILHTLHEFLVEDSKNEIKRDLDTGYNGALKENWIKIKDNVEEKEIERHCKSRGYQGKLHELLFAGHLRDNEEYEIKDLEAWGRNKDGVIKPDIFAAKNNQYYSFEVKFIGQDAMVFENTYLKNRGILMGPPEISDYILCKICEASAQLMKLSEDYHHGSKIALVIIEKSFHDTWIRKAIDFGYFKPDNLSFKGLHKEEMRNRLIEQAKGEVKKAMFEDIFSYPGKYIDNLDDFRVYNVSEYEYQQYKDIGKSIDNT